MSKSKNKEIEVNSIKEAQAKIAELNKDASLNKPSDEEVKAALEDFETSKGEFEIKSFKLGNPDIAMALYDFVIEFMDKYVQWTKNGWMGVIRMSEELKTNKKKHKDGESFNVTYHALEFLFYALSNPGGFGLKSAKALEKVSEMYINLYELSGKELEIARAELKNIQWLGDKAAAMSQGFYLEKEDGVEKEATDTFAAPSANDLIGKK